MIRTDVHFGVKNGAWTEICMLTYTFTNLYQQKVAMRSTGQWTIEIEYLSYKAIPLTVP
jgi:hypothetical protein